MSWWRDVLERLRPAGEVTLSVRIESEGIVLDSLPNPGHSVHLRWSDVVRIQTYKLDLFTSDCICLLLEMRDGQKPVQVTEATPGFSQLVAAISEVFPSIPSDWYLTVMFPAFETNRRVLYEQSR